MSSLLFGKGASLEDLINQILIELHRLNETLEKLEIDVYNLSPDVSDKA